MHRRTTIRFLLGAMAGLVSWTVLAGTIKDEADVFLTRDKKIGTLHRGASVTVIQESGEWIKVRYETIDAAFEGFVSRDLVSLEGGGPLEDPGPVGVSNEPVVTAVSTAATETAATRPPPAATGRPGASLGLATHWSTQNKSGGSAALDFLRMLRDVAKANANPVLSGNPLLYKDLYFLMPVPDALRSFGQSPAAGSMINTPGFPTASFKAYSFNSPADEFSRITLVGDLKNQLVAVQLSDSGQKDPWLMHRFERYEHVIRYSPDVKLFNLIEGSAKGSSSWAVGATMVQGSNGVVRIDTELLGGGADYERKSRERCRLYLPQPVADLCLYLLQSRK